MFVLTDLFIAFIIAAFLVAIFGIGLRQAGMGAGLFWFFLMLFLATWAGGLWITPIGPPLLGVSWLSYLLVGLFFVLLIMALLPPEPPERAAPNPDQLDAGPGAFVALNIFFWILLTGFIIAIVAGYLV